MPSRLAFRQETPSVYTATAYGVVYQVVGARSAFRAYRVTDDGRLHPAAEGGEKHSRASAYAQCEADLEHVLADRESAVDVGPVTDEQLAAVPFEYRRTVAQWLAERAGQFRQSHLFGEPMLALAREALQGAAVDLMTPGVDDTTIGHARAVLSELSGCALAADGVGALHAFTPRESDGLCGTTVPYPVDGEVRNIPCGGPLHHRSHYGVPGCSLAGDGEHDCADPTREADCRP